MNALAEIRPFLEDDGGDINFNNQSILDISPEERAQMGIFMSFQYPVEIPGVSVSNFIKTEDIASDYLTPGRKRMLENKTEDIDWEFNQDMSFEGDLMIDDEVLHKKYGTGIILKKDIDKAEVDFENFGLKKVYLIVTVAYASVT